jgi:hypothetical protein
MVCRRRNHRLRGVISDGLRQHDLGVYVTGEKKDAALKTAALHVKL